MTPLRRLVRDHRLCSAWVLMLALAMKVIVPAGFMPMVSGGTITIEVCRGFDSEPMTMAMPGMAAHDGKAKHPTNDHAGKDMPCAFSGLLAPALGGADAIQLAALVAAIVASGLWARTVLPERVAQHLRPLAGTTRAHLTPA